jgi:hypothetical protein
VSAISPKTDIFSRRRRRRVPVEKKKEKKRKEKSLTLFSPRAVNAYTSSARKQNAYLTIASITRKAALFDAE